MVCDCDVFLFVLVHGAARDGYVSIVTELQEQMNGQRPDVVVLSVGGGGLLVGIERGLQQVGWGDVRLVAVETYGAESLNACAVAGKHVSLDGIKSVAKTLGKTRIVIELVLILIIVLWKVLLRYVIPHSS